MYLSNWKPLIHQLFCCQADGRGPTLMSSQKGAGSKEHSSSCSSHYDGEEDDDDDEEEDNEEEDNDDQTCSSRGTFSTTHLCTSLHSCASYWEMTMIEKTFFFLSLLFLCVCQQSSALQFSNTLNLLIQVVRFTVICNNRPTWRPKLSLWWETWG